MQAKFRVTLTLDVDYESDVRSFLSPLDDMRYSIDKIESLERKPNE